ncbi:threonine/serine ThrE exporter family protein [Vallicoccus soli]|uniref:threonine/serine ThrE exporter family protein n=1 Tax=Vallicoccus soli TaxID=2339232 RepID=UPI0014020DF8|nr:threonine/serine exporter family protein [Vallicoccus soli]
MRRAGQREEDRRARERRARRAPVEPVHLPEPDEREAYRALDIALRAAEIVLSGGAGAADVTATVMAVAGACGLRRVEVDVTNTTITVSYVRAPDVAPVTSMRLVRARLLDYTRVTEVDNLVDDLVHGRLTPAEASERLDDVRHRRHPYGSWTVTAASALLAAAVAVLLGGGPLVAGVALLTSAVVDRVIRALARRHLPEFFRNAVGAAIATAAALVLAGVDVDVRPSLVVAGGIIVLLPGSALVGCVQDAITGFPVTAAGRALEVFVSTAGIIAGVAVALAVGSRAGVRVLLTSTSPSLGDLPLQVLSAGVAAAAFACANHAPRRTLPAAGVAGAAGWLVLALLQEAALGAALASAGGAVVVGAGSYALAHLQRVPPLLHVAAGIIPLLPGLTLFRGMLRLSQGDTVGGLLTLTQATSVGLALAAGVVLGSFLGQPAAREVARFERRIAGPSLAGPRLAGVRLTRTRLPALRRRP